MMPRRAHDEIMAFLNARAREMRRAPTPAEAHLWKALRPLGFMAQRPIIARSKNGGLWGYVLDFAWPVAGPIRLCVEVDGGYHARRKGRDRRRDTRLKTAGVRTIRLTNEYVLGATLAELRARGEQELDGGV